MVIDWTEKIDGLRLQNLTVSQAEIEAAYEGLPADLRDALHFAANRIQIFHQKQLSPSWLDWDSDGGDLGQMIVPLQRVGVYAPGGCQHAANVRCHGPSGRS